MDAVQATNGATTVTPTNTPTWWHQDEASGRIDPALLAPDPEQPRKHMDEAALEELTESVASVGVREPITVTPCDKAPWSTTDNQHQGLPFLVVSGHRRTRAAINAQLDSVPIRVRIYTSAQEHELDRSLLNKNRADLTELEEGYEIVRLKEKGLTLGELGKAFGCSVTHLYNRMHLTALHPSLQEMLDPALPPKRRLPTTVGAALGSVKVPTVEELEGLHASFGDMTTQSVEEVEYLDDTERRLHVQLLFHDVINARSLSSVRAVALVKEHALKLSASGTGRHPRVKRQEPARRRELFDTWLSSLSDSPIIDWRPEEWRRVFEYVSYEDLEEIIGNVQDATGLLIQIKKRLESIKSTKRPTSEAVKRALDS
jgi:ParB/RepB/Spo0J family partition protein